MFSPCSKERKEQHVSGIAEGERGFIDNFTSVVRRENITMRIQTGKTKKSSRFFSAFLLYITGTWGWYSSILSLWANERGANDRQWFSMHSQFSHHCRTSVCVCFGKSFSIKTHIQNKITDSQNRVSFNGNLSHLVQMPYNKQGHLQPDQFAQSPIKPGHKSFQGWGFHHLSEQPGSVFCHSHCKKNKSFPQSLSEVQ